MSGLKTIFKSALTSSASSAQDTLGDIRQEQFKRYKYVKFITAAVALNFVKYVADDTAYEASEVGVSTAQDEVGAGIALVTHLINYFGWIQISGISTVTALDAGAVGDALIPGGTNGTMDKQDTLEQQSGIVLHVANKKVLLTCPD